MHDLFQNDWSTVLWLDAERWHVFGEKVKCDSFVGVCPDAKTIAGAQGISGSILEQADLWWYGGGLGGVLRDIWEGDEGLRIFRTLENSREILEEPQEDDPKASFRKRLGGACGQYKAFWNFCGLWSDVLCVSGEDVIFFPLEFIIHSCQKIVKSVWKMTEEYFSNLPSSMLSEVTLYLFERQEDRERGTKSGDKGEWQSWVKTVLCTLSSSLYKGKECRKHFHGKK